MYITCNASRPLSEKKRGVPKMSHTVTVCCTTNPTADVCCDNLCGSNDYNN